MSVTETASEAIVAGYHRQTRNRLVRVAGFAAATMAAILFDILTGPAFLSPLEVLVTMFGVADDPMLSAIVFSVRLPMTLMAVIVGASLGIAGVEMQTILGNPLASPYTLGFSAAAGFGAALAILFAFQLPLLATLTVPAVSFVFATLACLIVYGLARARGVTSEIMILAGIATLFLFQSAQSLVQYLAAPEVLQQIVFWLFGSMLKASWTSVAVSGAILAFSVALLVPDFWRLTALRLGDERVRALGINVDRLRLRIFLAVSLLTAGAVAFVGTIGFVGLVAPHLARMAVGEDQRFLVPASALSGAFVMAAASVVSKSISPGAVIPIGIVTAIIGVPFLFALILKSRRSFW